MTPFTAKGTPMQAMSFHPAVAGIGSHVVASSLQGVQAAVMAAPAVTMLPPAGVDDVSIQAVAAFSTEAAQLLATLTAAHQELVRTGITLTEVARIYTEADAAAARGVSRVRPSFSYPIAR